MSTATVSHTPGPWTYVQSGATVIAIESKGHPEQFRASVKMHPGYVHVAQANAQLISDAPAMDLALRLIASAQARIEISRHVPGLVEFCFDGIRYCLNGNWTSLMDTIGWDRARAAVEKVTVN